MKTNSFHYFYSKSIWMIRTFILIFLCTVFLFGTAVSQTDTTGAHQRYLAAEDLMDDRAYDSAKYIFKDLAALYVEASQEKYHSCLNMVASCHLSLSQVDSARVLIDLVLGEATEDSLQWLTAKFNQVEWLVRTGKNDDATEMAQLVKERIGTPASRDGKKLLADVEYVLGAFSWGQIKVQEALSHMKVAVALRKEVYGRQSDEVAALLTQMTLGYIQVGELDNAKAAVKEALDTYRSRNETNVAINLQAASLYTLTGQANLALELATEGFVAYKIQELNNDVLKVALLDVIVSNLTQLDRAGEAKIYHRELITLREKAYGKESLLYFLSLLNLADSYTALTEYDSASYFLQKAERIDKKLKIADSFRGMMYAQMGGIHTKKGEYETGRRFYRKAIAENDKEAKMFQAKNKMNYQYKGVPYYQGELAKSYMATNELDKGLEEVQFGLITCARKFDSRDPADNPSRDSIINVSMAVNLLILKAEILKRKAERDQDEEYLKRAMACYHLADELALEHNKVFTNIADAFLIYQHWRVIYLELLKLSDSAEEQYQYMEKSRALQFRRKNNEVIAKAKADIPPELLHFEDSIKKSMARFKTEMLSATDSSGQAATASFFKVRRTLDSLVAYYDEQFPLYHQMKYQNNITTVADIQQSLDAQTLMIQYHVGEDKIFALSITADEVNMNEIDLTDSLKYAVDLCKLQLETVGAYEVESFAYHANHLYTNLIQPIVEKYNDEEIAYLVVLPDDILWNVNFELLHTQPFTGTTEIPYLLKDYAVRYVYSQSAMENSKVQKRQPAKNLLAFSYGEVDAAQDGNQLALSALRSSNEELPGSRMEIRSIAQLVDGDYYYGAFASEEQFKAIAEDYKVLHLAVHGITDSKEPDHSKLDFFQKGDSNEDGQLHAFELYNMQLNADLAVLSACQTGSGYIVSGEGVMSLGRAFSYAGVNSLILTRWDVSDAFTPQIMELFYRGLDAGKTKSEALRDAKLAFLASSDNLTSNPFYWGSFYILGDDTPVEFDRAIPTWMYLGGVAVFALMVFFGLWKSKRPA